MSAGADATRARELLEDALAFGTDERECKVCGYAHHDRAAGDMLHAPQCPMRSVKEAAALLRRLAAAPAKDRETLARAMFDEFYGSDEYRPPYDEGWAAIWQKKADGVLAALGRARPEPEAKP